ncbi:hypothetical protein [Bacillus infantis]|uniref:hypothetical protein n=1 Tax=Bacillus infantis TaxID=324767 RepID=UPI00215563C3|nr:hypothetical protein [Bacillus infantis]MCR6611262.1 hypothetical protein [Bacillus infantis]
MRIEKLKTYYGYDLLIDRVIYKRCLSCESWFPFEDEMGFCRSCIRKAHKPCK